MRAFPSYLHAAHSFFIEKSKRRMIAEDIAAALSLLQQSVPHWTEGLRDPALLRPVILLVAADGRIIGRDRRQDRRVPAVVVRTLSLATAARLDL
jgi:hypothetical protein